MVSLLVSACVFILVAAVAAYVMVRQYQGVGLNDIEYKVATWLGYSLFIPFIVALLCVFFIESNFLLVLFWYVTYHGYSALLFKGLEFIPPTSKVATRPRKGRDSTVLEGGRYLNWLGRRHVTVYLKTFGRYKSLVIINIEGQDVTPVAFYITLSYDFKESCMVFSEHQYSILLPRPGINSLDSFMRSEGGNRAVPHFEDEQAQLHAVVACIGSATVAYNQTSDCAEELNFHRGNIQLLRKLPKEVLCLPLPSGV